MTRWCPPRPVLITLIAGVLITVGPTVAGAQLEVELTQETVEAYEAIVQSYERALDERTDDAATPFMWSGESPDRLMTVRTGEILVETAEVSRIPDGMMHVWLAAMFIPDASGEDVIAVLEDFDQHERWYPEVLESKALGREGDTIKGFLKIRKQKVLTAILNTEYEATFTQHSPDRWSVRSVATRIAEVSNPDETPEMERPVGNDSGFLWRLNTYWRVEEVEGGVLAECLSLSLSRDIPTGLGWMISPIIRSLPRESLSSLMQATRLAVKGLTN